MSTTATLLTVLIWLGVKLAIMANAVVDKRDDILGGPGRGRI